MSLRLFIFAFLFVFTVFPSMASATADGPDFYAVKDVANDDVLNMRIEPDYKSDKVGEIPHDGHGLKNLGCNTDDMSMGMWLDMTPEQRKEHARKRWCKVEYDGITGWVSGKFLKEDAANMDYGD